MDFRGKIIFQTLVRYSWIINEPLHPGVLLDVKPQDKLKEIIKRVESISFIAATPFRFSTCYNSDTIELRCCNIYMLYSKEEGDERVWHEMKIISSRM